uniref:Uncharacterized protein n=1 Tax=Anguilla anguilla TaxID=7936 RepID=A0A0E9QS71_ANGAN
MCVLLKPNNF